MTTMAEERPVRVELPYRFFDDWRLRDTTRKWCRANFADGTWEVMITYATFKNEQDAMLFTLRWS